jgi:hypothetical protein
MRRHLFWLAVLVLASFSFAGAQGIQTGTITGVVKSSDGQPLPGATVSVKSTALQGVRTAVTDSNGNYIFKALPTGAYTVTFELTGMTTVEKKTTLELGATISIDGSLSVAAVQETVTVTAEAPSVLQQTTVGANYKGEAIDTLATQRTLQGIAELAPGLTDNTPNAGQVTISGSMAFDNVFLVNGVDVNDNLFGTANNLFIEDAVEEIQVLTSGISAEYGRFGGGVVNAITKRGGNAFSGSFRVDLTNPSWRDENPLEDRNGTERTDITNKIYSATLGGPIVKDKLWFFLAGRKEDTTADSTFRATNQSYTSEQSNDRIEAKLTATIAQNHTLQGSYLNNSTEQTGPSLGTFAADPATFYNPPRTLPNNLFVVSYSGVLSSNLFAEVQYSQKKFKFENSGGSSTNTLDSPIFTLNFSPAVYYNAPYFDSTDPEERNNRQIAGSLSYFLSTASFGRHDIKAGYENYRSTNTGGNSQTSTGWVFYADYLGTYSNPTLDSNGRFQPIFTPFENLGIRWVPDKGARIDVTTQSFYVNDRWQVNSKLSANVGARYERVRSEATGGIVGADTDTIVPRLALSYDVTGDGKWKLDATYAQYSGKYSESQFANNTTVGNPSYFYYLYTGPAGVGRGCTACFDPANYNIFLGGSIPTANVFFEEGLSSPKTREFTFAAGVALPKGGYLKAIYTDRKTSNFFEGFTDLTTGTTDLEFEGNFLGTVDNTIYRNTDERKREYRAFQLQGSYRITDAWSVNGHWTHQLAMDGDYEGEGTNTPGATDIFGDYPEAFNAARHFPDGRLNDYQADKVRLWTNYDLGLGKAGRLNIGLLYRYDSPLTQSIIAANQSYSAIQNAGRSLYAAPPNVLSNDVYFGERGALEFDAASLFDLALTYEVPIYKTLRPWVKFDMRNVANSKTQIFGSGSVRQDPASPKDSLGLATGYIPNASFKTATANGDYVLPREWRVSIGFRF